MVAFTPSDQDRLRAAVAAAESRTSAEIVIAIAEVSEDYRIYPWIWSAAIGFAAAAVIALLWPDTHVRFAFVVMGAALLLSALILHLRPIHLLLVPSRVRRRAAAALAAAEFADRVAGKTQDATGLLIFVALAEHYVAVVPDSGLKRIVPEAAWQTVVADLAGAMGANRTVDGLIAAIDACARLTAEKLPQRADDRDELPDAVINIQR